jgi:hypothetical protein
VVENRVAAQRTSKEYSAFICGCLGPCDVPNVVKIDTGEESVWLGKIERFDQYRGIVDWASQSKAGGRLLPLPKDLDAHRLDPFR